MWEKTIGRARRQLRRTPDEQTATTAASGGPLGAADLVVTLSRADLDRFVRALAALLDPDMPRPDSPARVAGAVTTAIEQTRGKGHATVTRSPAGLYAPEYWHIRIAGADEATRRTMAMLQGEGRVAS
jgi:hypothetical protein